MSFETPAWIRLGILLSAGYLFFIGIALQLFDKARTARPS